MSTTVFLPRKTIPPLHSKTAPGCVLFISQQAVDQIFFFSSQKKSGKRFVWLFVFGFLFLKRPLVAQDTMLHLLVNCSRGWLPPSASLNSLPAPPAPLPIGLNPSPDPEMHRRYKRKTIWCAQTHQKWTVTLPVKQGNPNISHHSCAVVLQGLPASILD